MHTHLRNVVVSKCVLLEKLMSTLWSNKMKSFSCCVLYFIPLFLYDYLYEMPCFRINLEKDLCGCSYDSFHSVPMTCKFFLNI